MGKRGLCGDKLNVLEAYTSLQGEGPFAGQPTFFIRLAGCNLRCSFCDTKFSWLRPKERDETSLNSLLAIIPPEINFVDITGGEPFLQNILPLIYRLLDARKFVLVETNGTLFEKLPPQVHLMVSPKRAFPLRKKALGYFGKRDRTVFKLVVNPYSKEDTDFWAKFIRKHRTWQFYIMPEGVTVRSQTVGARLLSDWIFRERLHVALMPRLHILLWGNTRSR